MTIVKKPSLWVFFERNNGLRWFLSLMFAFMGFIWGFFVWKNYQVNISQKTNSSTSSIVFQTSWFLQASDIGNTYNWNVTKKATQIEEENAKMEKDARINLEAFFRRRARWQIQDAYKQLDQELSKDQYFQVHNLLSFKRIILRGFFYLDNLVLQSPCQSSRYVDRCEFNFTLKYINKLINKRIAEKWHIDMIIDKNQFNYFKIWKITCIDKNCENNPLFWTWMIFK